MLWSYLRTHPVAPADDKGGERDADEEREGRRGGTRTRTRGKEEEEGSCRRGFAVHLLNNKSVAVGSANDDEVGIFLIWMTMPMPWWVKIRCQIQVQIFPTPRMGGNQASCVRYYLKDRPIRSYRTELRNSLLKE